MRLGKEEEAGGMETQFKREMRERVKAYRSALFDPLQLGRTFFLFFSSFFYYYYYYCSYYSKFNI